MFLKLLRGGKLFILGFFKKFEIVMITSFTILLKYILLNHSIESLFVRICFYLWSSVKISSFYENLFKSFLLAKIYSFFFFLSIFLNLFFITIVGESVFLNLHENRQMYEYHNLKQIFYYQSTILIFRWFWNALNSTHFVSDYFFVQ